MAVIIRLQNLSWSANASDIRRFFSGLSIPEGGVHIVGGEFGDAFITFTSDEDARLALRLDGQELCGEVVKLFISSNSEMEQVILRARQAVSATQEPAAPPAGPAAPMPPPTAAESIAHQGAKLPIGEKMMLPDNGQVQYGAPPISYNTSQPPPPPPPPPHFDPAVASYEVPEKKLRLDPYRAHDDPYHQHHPPYDAAQQRSMGRGGRGGAGYGEPEGMPYRPNGPMEDYYDRPPGRFDRRQQHRDRGANRYSDPYDGGERYPPGQMAYQSGPASYVGRENDPRLAASPSKRAGMYDGEAADMTTFTETSRDPRLANRQVDNNRPTDTATDDLPRDPRLRAAGMPPAAAAAAAAAAAPAAGTAGDASWDMDYYTEPPPPEHAARYRAGRGGPATGGSYYRPPVDREYPYADRAPFQDADMQDDYAGHIDDYRDPAAFDAYQRGAGGVGMDYPPDSGMGIGARGMTSGYTQGRGGGGRVEAPYQELQHGRGIGVRRSYQTDTDPYADGPNGGSYGAPPPPSSRYPGVPRGGRGGIAPPPPPPADDGALYGDKGPPGTYRPRPWERGLPEGGGDPAFGARASAGAKFVDFSHLVDSQRPLSLLGAPPTSKGPDAMHGGRAPGGSSRHSSRHEERDPMKRYEYQSGKSDNQYIAIIGIPMEARFADITGALPDVKLSRSGIKYEEDAVKRRTGQAFIKLNDKDDLDKALQLNGSAMGGDRTITVRASSEHEFHSANDPTLKLPMPHDLPRRRSPYYRDCCLEINNLPRPPHPKCVRKPDVIEFFDGLQIADPDADIFIDETKLPESITIYVQFANLQEFILALDRNVANGLSHSHARSQAISRQQMLEYMRLSLRKADGEKDYRLTRAQRKAIESAAAKRGRKGENDHNDNEEEEEENNEENGDVEMRQSEDGDAKQQQQLDEGEKAEAEEENRNKEEDMEEEQEEEKDEHSGTNGQHAADDENEDMQQQQQQQQQQQVIESHQKKMEQDRLTAQPPAASLAS